MNLSLFDPPLPPPPTGPVPGLLLPEPPGWAGSGQAGPAALSAGGAASGGPVQADLLAEPAEPGALHPALWRASQLGGGRQATTATGFAALDAQLPGGGWPHGVLTELLLAQPGIGELRLLAPALVALGRSAPGEGPPCVMLFDPPARLSAWALAQQGLCSRHWLVVQGRGAPDAGPAATRSASASAPAVRAPRAVPRSAGGGWPLLASADLLWALEQALRSGHVGAVLAWLPLGLRADAVRRLQLAAQSHAGPVFLFRDALARSKPSAAPLRLLLQPTGVDGLALRLLKRRGPPLDQTLRLQLPPVLTPQQQAQALTRQLVRGAAAGALAPLAAATAATTAAAISSQPG